MHSLEIQIRTARAPIYQEMQSLLVKRPMYYLDNPSETSSCSRNCKNPPCKDPTDQRHLTCCKTQKETLLEPAGGTL
jgi:hypothetical protein